MSKIINAMKDLVAECVNNSKTSKNKTILFSYFYL